MTKSMYRRKDDLRTSYKLDNLERYCSLDEKDKKDKK